MAEHRHFPQRSRTPRHTTNNLWLWLVVHSVSLFSLSLFLVACTPVDNAPRSAWGEIRTIAQTEQGSAPSLYISSQGTVTAAWIGADKTGIHHDIRQNFAETVVLPLPPVFPYAQTLYPASVSDTIHLLWLDADYQQRDDPLAGNTTYLFAAFISANLTIQRGPTRISNLDTLHYAAVPISDGGLWAAWSGGVAAEPELYAQRIDNSGRPLAAQRIALNADYPVLARIDDSTLLLFWTQPTTGTIYRAQLVEGVAQDITAISHAPLLNAGDRLVNISAGLDRTHAYLLWNITRADGHSETWWVSGTFDAAQWPEPQRLGIATTEEPFVTGFNGGDGVVAAAGETWLSWTAPLNGQFDTLSAAVWDGAQLGVLYWQAGEIVGYQAVVAVDLLIGVPTLTTNRDRHLYLAWSYPSAAGYANLLLTSTHP